MGNFQELKVWQKSKDLAIIAYEIGYLDKKTFKFLENECQAISGMLTRLIKARS